MTAADNPRGSGVAKTEYSFNGTGWNPYAAPFTITNELTTTVYYRSTDNAGNVEVASREISYTQLDMSSVFNSDAYTSGRSYCWGGCTYPTNPGTVYTDAQYGAVPMDMKPAGANNVWLSAGNDRTSSFPTSFTLNTNVSGATNIWIAGFDGGWVYDGSPVEVRYVLDGQQYSQSYNPNDWCWTGTDPRLSLWLNKGGSCGDIAVARIDLPRSGTLSQVSVIDKQGVGGASIPVFAVTAGKARQTFKSVALKIDQTPPTISGVATTPPNANGWYKSDVVVHFTASDATSGPASVSGPTTLSAEGANQSVTGTATDMAGNSASFTVLGINIDKTPPTSTAFVSPSPNAQGWNNTSVSVTISATDTLSGIARTEYNLDNAGWVAYAGPLSITAEGIHTLLYRSLDRADNQEADRSLTIRMDKTPPEAYNQFDPASKDLLVFGRDALSGVPAGAVAPISVSPAKWGEGDEDEDDDKGNAELRTYKIVDLAGNTLVLVEKVKREGKEIKARVVSLQYNGGPVISPSKNKKSFEWSVDKDGALKELEQDMEVGMGKERRQVEAKYEAKKNQTTIKVDEPKPETKVVRAGLALLRLATDKGKLGIEY